MYKCKKCKHSVFFRPDFSTQRISCEEYTGQEHCVVFVIIYFLLAVVGLLIYLAIVKPEFFGFINCARSVLLNDIDFLHLLAAQIIRDDLLRTGPWFPPSSKV